MSNRDRLIKGFMAKRPPGTESPGGKTGRWKLTPDQFDRNGAWSRKRLKPPRSLISDDRAHNA
jgi:hypothetical protein